MTPAPGYGRFQRGVELASIAAFAVLSAGSLLRLAAATGAWLPLVAAAAALGGWLIVDLASGLLHWTLDRCGSVHTPLVGPALIRPFREHHRDPQLMVGHDFVELNGASCFACLPILAATALMPLVSTWAIAGQALLLFAALGALVTNQCHQWAHAAAAPRLVRWAQRRRLVLSPQAHALHHTPPFDRHFCMANGWLNRPFDAVLRAWR